MLVQAYYIFLNNCHLLFPVLSIEITHAVIWSFSYNRYIQLNVSQQERLWRRTRSVNLNVSTTCFGVDANRNFDVDFNTVGVSSDPCSQTYPGVEAFSEPETRANRDVVLQYAERIALYIDVHSHGNWVLFGKFCLA